MNPRTLHFLMFSLSLASTLADGPADNVPDKVRPVPPPGIAIAESDRVELTSAMDGLAAEIESLSSGLANRPALISLLPDVKIFHKAVHDAVKHNEFYKTNEVQIARRLLEQGWERAKALREGRSPWATATGLVIRAYQSKIDGSIQPYALVVPSSAGDFRSQPHRLDTWFHGRGETLTELAFVSERQRSPGEFVPANAFVLHLYGRYCNANKFAGEIDLFEALDHVQKQYSIDSNRIVVRGFSMGGAACWQFAVHYAGLWAAAAPGAGFSETAEFLKVFQDEKVQVPWFQQRLWHWYDCTDYAVNLFNCPTVAYSGEIDRQKQAADVMARALAAEGVELTHIIGPKTAHKYHPDSKDEINRRIDSIVERGRNPVPKKVRFTTWTLRYNRMLWVTVDALGQHWERARVDAEILDDHTIKAATTNVVALTFSMPAGHCPLDNTTRPVVVLDGQKLTAAAIGSDRSWLAHFRKNGPAWQPVESAEIAGLRKRHALQGPIDDAFMDSFLMVLPTGRPLNAKVGAWSSAEQSHAIDHWRRQFRGEARVKRDQEITDEDLAQHHLVLWGDPQSNALLAKIANQLPIRWDTRGVHTGDAIYPADRYVPVLIYPNPLNPKRYVVLNSGFTFREYDYLNNARQIAKLPDYAILDIDVPVTSRAPGGIVTAGFFGEEWELRPAR